MSDIYLEGDAVDEVFEYALDFMPQGAAAIADMIAGREKQRPLSNQELFYKTYKAMRFMDIGKSGEYLDRGVFEYLRQHFDMSACGIMSFRIKSGKDSLTIRFKKGCEPSPLTDVHKEKPSQVIKPVDAFLKKVVVEYLKARFGIDSDSNTVFDVLSDAGTITLVFNEKTVPEELLAEIGKPVDKKGQVSKEASANDPAKRPVKKTVSRASAKSKSSEKPKTAASRRKANPEAERAAAQPVTM